MTIACGGKQCFQKVVLLSMHPNKATHTRPSGQDKEFITSAIQHAYKDVEVMQQEAKAAEFLEKIVQVSTVISATSTTTYSRHVCLLSALTCVHSCKPATVLHSAMRCLYLFPRWRSLCQVQNSQSCQATWRHRGQGLHLQVSMWQWVIWQNPVLSHPVIQTAPQQHQR